MNLTTVRVPVPVEPSNFCKSQAFLLRVKKSKATISRDLWVRTGSQSTCYYETMMSQLIQPLKLTTSPGEAVQWQWFRILPHLPISAQVIVPRLTQQVTFSIESHNFSHKQAGHLIPFSYTPTQWSWRIRGGGNLQSLKSLLLNLGFILTTTSVYMLPTAPPPKKKKDDQEVTMPRTISSLRHGEVTKTRLQPYSSWATHQGVGGLEWALDSGLNLIPFKGDVVTISSQTYSSSKIPAQRIVVVVLISPIWTEKLWVVQLLQDPVLF